jgi:hypothetical protein
LRNFEKYIKNISFYLKIFYFKKKYICNIGLYISFGIKMLHEINELDLTNANRRLWLVKVPKYIAERWEKIPDDTDIGTLAVTK